MLLSARDLEDGARLMADVCIAGAGAAGITLALELADSGLEVIVLAGGAETGEEPFQALYEGESGGIQAFRPRDHRVRAFGGSTHQWSGWCRPLDPEDFEARDYMPGDGWPITRAQLDPFYARAQRTLELGAYDYDAERLAGRGGHPLLPLSGDVVSEVFQYSKPTRMGARYGPELDAAGNVRVYLHGHLIDIVEGGGGVGELACGTLEGPRFTVEAARHVLALGGIENARMLLAAGDGAGVANGSGLVGVGFMEHPHYYRRVTLLLAEPQDLDFYARQEVDTRLADDDPEARVPVMGVLGLGAGAREREGLPHFLLQVQPAEIDAIEAMGATGELGPLGVAELMPGGGERSLVRFTSRLEQTRTADSAVTLVSERDALGIPRVRLSWAIDADDNRKLLRALTLLGNEVGRSGLGRLWIPTEGDAFRATDPQGGCHHMGTTRMGGDPQRAVADADGRCFGLDNLYLAGSSLFPSGGASNPTLTIVALAHRLADHLKETA